VTVDQAFDQAAAYYDDWVRKALPNYDELFVAATELIPFSADEAVDVLDLGAGTGLFSWHVLQKLPGARFVLVDLATRLLAIAQSRFRDNADQFQFVEGDYQHLDFSRQFDLAISSISVHHLDDSEKQTLFGRIHNALRSGGLFINVDQVKAPTTKLQELYWSNWLKGVRERGGSEEEIRSSIRRRKEFDNDALLVDQLRWLENAGFADVDCIYKNWFVGVFCAFRP
jgi:tRNA (cmo5U34)-methyltransferase